MDIDAKEKKLKEAQGDPRKLTLVAIDILLSSREPWLREALEAAAIPHWFTAEILTHLLTVDQPTSEKYLEALRTLPFVERFESRAGWNVHEATRLALRSELARTSPPVFKNSPLSRQSYSRRRAASKSRAHLSSPSVGPAEAQTALYDLWKKWYDSGRFESLQTLAVSLSELLATTPLDPVARARVLLCYGLIQRERIPSAEVEKLAREALALFLPAGDRLAEVDSRDLLGDILSAQGRRAEALREYQEYQRIMLDLTKRDPGNADWLRDLAVSHNKVGGILAAGGRREEALREHQEGKRIMLDLTKRDPGNTGWLRELAVSHNNVGGILAVEGRREEALREYQEYRRIMLDLTQRDPGNAGWLRELSVSHNKVGSILAAQRRREEALREYQEYRRIMLDLTQRDPTNASWLRELSVSHANVGGILEAEGRREEALREYQEAKRIRLDLVKRDPGNAGWLRDLSVSHSKVGSLLEAEGRREEALREYQEAKRIRLDLVKRDSGNADWLRGLLVSHNNIGSLLAASPETHAEALAEYKHSLAIAERLVQIDPENKLWADDLATCLESLSHIQRLIDDRAQQSSASA